MTDFFKDKNLLALYPAEDSGFPMRFDPLKRHFASVRLLNYASACHEEGIKNTERRILDTVAREKTDLVLCCPFASDYQLSVEFYAALREKTRVVFWFADDPLYFESYNRYYAQAADAVITSDYLAVAAYARLEIPAQVCQDELTASNKYFPVKIEKDIDVCFIGDMRKRGRREYIDFLRDAGIKVEVYGQGSPNGYLPAKKISEYLCRSRINLNFSQVGAPDWKNDDEPLLNRVRQNTGRPREVAAAGAFCLTEYSPALETMLTPGKELDFFRDKEELLAKVKFYLANPEKREAMAAAAHAHAARSYRAETFVENLLDGLAARLAAPAARPGRLYLSRSFKTREINSRTFSMFAMLKRFRLAAAAETFFMLFRHGPLVFLAGFTGGLARAARNALGKVGPSRPG